MSVKSKRYVEFTSGGINVNIGRYLKSEEGQAALKKIEAASKKFDRLKPVVSNLSG